MSSVVRRPVAVAVALALVLGTSGSIAAIAFGCGQYGTSEPEPKDDAAVIEPDSGGGDANEAMATDPCDHAKPPGPPIADDDATGELLPFWVGVREILFTTSKDAPPVGFDLDDVCTCDTRPGTARGGVASCKKNAPTCDTTRGIDNATGNLVNTLSPLYPVDALPNRLIGKGRRTLVIEISKYNGKPNDKDVGVAIAMSEGIRTQGCPSSVFDPSTNTWSPGWCGDDAWTLKKDTLLPSTTKPLLQANGWVRDGRLGFDLPTVTLPFSEVATVDVAFAAFSGKLVPLGEDLAPRDPSRPPTTRELRLWSLEDAVAAGRIRATQLLASLGTIEQTSDAGPTYLCQSSAFPLLRSGVCDAVDIARSRAFDFDDQTKCDALSMGVAFKAFPILAGAVIDAPASANPCIPGPSGQPTDAGVTQPYTCE